MLLRGYRCRYSIIIIICWYKWIGYVLCKDIMLGIRIWEGKRKRGSYDYYGEDRLKMKKIMYYFCGLLIKMV